MSPTFNTTSRIIPYRKVQRRLGPLRKSIAIRRLSTEAARALLRAARTGCSETMLEALKWGADVNITNSKGLTALSLAAARGDASMVSFLLHVQKLYGSNRGKDTRTALLHAAIRDNSHFGPIQTPFATKRSSLGDRRSAEIALCEAARHGQVETLNILLEDGVNPNAQNQAGFSAIHFASDGHGEILRSLIAAGADVNIQEPTNQRTPLMLAAACAHKEGVEILLERTEIDTNLINDDGETAQDIASGALCILDQEKIKDSLEIQALLQAATSKVT